MPEEKGDRWAVPDWAKDFKTWVGVVLAVVALWTAMKTKVIPPMHDWFAAGSVSEANVDSLRAIKARDKTMKAYFDARLDSVRKDLSDVLRGQNLISCQIDHIAPMHCPVDRQLSRQAGGIP